MIFYFLFVKLSLVVDHHKAKCPVNVLDAVFEVTGDKRGPGHCRCLCVNSCHHSQEADMGQTDCVY